MGRFEPNLPTGGTSTSVLVCEPVRPPASTGRPSALSGEPIQSAAGPLWQCQCVLLLKYSLINHLISHFDRLSVFPLHTLFPFLSFYGLAAIYHFPSLAFFFFSVIFFSSFFFGSLAHEILHFRHRSLLSFPTDMSFISFCLLLQPLRPLSCEHSPGAEDLASFSRLISCPYSTALLAILVGREKVF